MACSTKTATQSHREKSLRPAALGEAGGMRPVLLIGANGQLGSDLSKEFRLADTSLVQVTRADLELRNHDQVTRVLEAVRPRVIVNTAAFHKVEACETDVDQAFAV